MTPEMKAFRESVWQDARATASAEGGYTREALLEVLAGRLVVAEELPEWTQCFYQGTGSHSRRISVDGYDASELALDGSVRLLALVSSDGSTDPVLSQTSINTAYKQAMAFVIDALAGRLHATLEPSHPAADLAQLLFDNRGSLKIVRVYVLSDLPASDLVKAGERDPLGAAASEVHVWDISRFFKLAAAGGHEPIDLNVLEYVPDGLPSLAASTGSTEHESLLSVLPGSFLADIYERYGARLLEGNVRSFLSARGNVNKGIRATIRSEPHRFFAYNNGITATASHVDRDKNGKITRIVDLQIVNGGQTTASLYNTRARDGATLANIYVQMKLSVVSPELALELVPSIARYANHQNKVSDADLFANHAFLRRLEELSRRVWAPASGGGVMTLWFFERARAQFETEQVKLPPPQKRKFLLQSPKAQLITKTDLAKVENTWRLRPNEVSLGAQKNFMAYADFAASDFDNDPDRFNEVWYQHFIARVVVYKATESLVSNASWYARGFRANIVTYTIARTLKLIETEFPRLTLNLHEIWRTQTTPSLLLEQLSIVGEAMQDIILEPPPSWKNVTEWCKKSKCWEKADSADIRLVDGLEELLIDKNVLANAIKSAQRQTKDDRKVDAVVEVVRLNQEGYWVRALASPDAERELSSIQLGILQTAVQRGRHWVPSDAQAKRLMEAHALLTAVGFR